METWSTIELGAARRRVRKAFVNTSPSERLRNLELAVKHYEAIDEYLRDGGELPEQWKDAHPWVAQ